jgi:hypothetical protein
MWLAFQAVIDPPAAINYPFTPITSPGEQGCRGVSYFDGWGNWHLIFGLTPA